MPPAQTPGALGENHPHPARPAGGGGNRETEPVWAKVSYPPIAQSGRREEYRRRLPEEGKDSPAVGGRGQADHRQPHGQARTIYVFPEQVVNWPGTPKTGAVVSPRQGAESVTHRRRRAAGLCRCGKVAVCHGCVQGHGAGSDNAVASGLATGPSAGWWIDCAKFVVWKSAGATPTMASSWTHPHYGCRTPAARFWKSWSGLYLRAHQPVREVLKAIRPLLVGQYTLPACPSRGHGVYVKDHVGVLERFGAGKTSCDITACFPATGWYSLVAQRPFRRMNSPVTAVAASSLGRESLGMAGIKA